MRGSEWIAVAYFAYLVAVGLVLSPHPARRWRVAGEGIAAAAVVVLIAAAESRSPSVWLTVVRDWAPLVYLLWGYWIPAHVRDGLDSRIESALRRADVRWAAPFIGSVAHSPRVLVDALELSYLLCYPMLPVGFALVRYPHPRGVPDAYHAAVLMAAALSYGVLPWVRTRPPRAVEPPPVPASAVRALNERLLHRASVQLNTVPSGHVATAVAAAAAVLAVAPPVGVVFAVLALGIGLTCVARRYHYLVDVVMGVIVGGVGFIVSRLVS